jgi:two-component system OmpR family response regulator
LTRGLSVGVNLDVLLVEDDALVLATLGEALRLAGLETERHTSAEAALESLGQQRPRAVVTDINLGSGMDGVTLGRVVRARYPEVPFVYISGRYSELRGLTGQERFLLKPFSASLLLRALRELDVAVARDLAIQGG